LQDELAWREAEGLWRQEEPTAYDAWRQLDPKYPRGREARGRLDKADTLYRRAVEQLRTEQPGVVETVDEAKALAPMDPDLYLPLARIARARGRVLKAAEFYVKYLTQRSASQDAAAARAELTALIGEDWGFGDGRQVPRPGVSNGHKHWPIGYLLAPVGLVFLVLGLFVWLRRRHFRPLREIVLARPELHQTISYQIGCLRHEFLKHRIGAAGDALQALIGGQASPEQRRFLEERFCKGEPLLAAWRAHMGALERSLGLRFTLAQGDPLFRAAQRALPVLTRAATRTNPAATRRVEQAWEQLERLDRELASLLARLAFCPVDEALLHEVLQSTRSEWASGKIELDEVVVGPVPVGVAVDVYGTDLRIVLKNIFRNAIAALGDSPRPRRLAVDVLVELEPTGQEVVRIRVRDSSRHGIEAMESAAEAASVEHGLGIVRTALLRYDGSLQIEAGGDAYAKAVIVRLFRSLCGSDTRVGEAA
jgi:signal transduction histidine kinase